MLKYGRSARPQVKDSIICHKSGHGLKWSVVNALLKTNYYFVYCYVGIDSLDYDSEITYNIGN